MKTIRTWVLIADAGRARVLASEGPGKGLAPVEGLALENELPPTHELVRDRQPRSMESVGNMRHPITPRTDPRRKEKRRFAAEIASALEEQLEIRAFDRLVVVAPPRALGDLRDAMPESVRLRVVNEVAKDLTKTPDGEVERHLGLSFAL
jgi:protein required for attachment to host cells